MAEPSIYLREYIERILDVKDEAYKARLQATIREADAKAAELERRLQGFDQWKSDQERKADRYVDRTSDEIKHAALAEKIEEMKDAIATIRESRANSAGFVAGVIVAAGVVAAAVSALVAALTG